MSQENVEVVLRAFAECQRGDFWVSEFSRPGRSRRAGGSTPWRRRRQPLDSRHDHVHAGLAQDFDNMSMVAERVVDAGDQVVVIAAWQGRGKASGVDIEWRHRPCGPCATVGWPA